MNEDQRICFVIAPIGQKGSEIRRRSDQILKYVVRPATDECGYRAMRADEISEPGEITSQVITHTINDPVVIADLTDWNPNVFYELAIRHAVRKPFVLLFQSMPERERIPFDVAQQRVVDLDYPDWDSMEASTTKLVEAIKAAEAMEPKKLVTPITHAINLQRLTESEDPTANVLAEILHYLRRLDAEIRFMQSDVRSRTSMEAMEDVIDEVIRRKAWRAP